jgi:hypothetical protein
MRQFVATFRHIREQNDRARAYEKRRETARVRLAFIEVRAEYTQSILLYFQIMCID